MADSKAGTGKVQDKPGTPFLPDDKKALKKGWGHVKRIQKSALRGSHWPNLGQCDH